MILRLVIAFLLWNLIAILTRKVSKVGHRLDSHAIAQVWGMTGWMLGWFLLVYVIVGVWSFRTVIDACLLVAGASYLLHVIWRATHPTPRSLAFETLRVLGELTVVAPRRMLLRGLLIFLASLPLNALLILGLVFYARSQSGTQRMQAALVVLSSSCTLLFALLALGAMLPLARWTLDDDTRAYLLMRVTALSIPVYVFSLLLAFYRQPLLGWRLPLLDTPLPMEPRINILILTTSLLLLVVGPFLHGAHRRRNQTLLGLTFQKDRILAQIRITEHLDAPRMRTALSSEVSRLDSEMNRVHADLLPPHEWLHATILGLNYGRAAKLGYEGAVEVDSSETLDSLEELCPSRLASNLREWAAEGMPPTPLAGGFILRAYRLRKWEVRSLIRCFGLSMADELERKGDSQFRQLQETARLIHAFRQFWVPIDEWGLRVAELGDFAIRARDAASIDAKFLQAPIPNLRGLHRPARSIGRYLLKLSSAWNELLDAVLCTVNDALRSLDELPAREPSWSHMMWLEENREAVTSLLSAIMSGPRSELEGRLKQQWDRLNQSYSRTTDEEGRVRAQKTVLARAILPLTVPAVMAVCAPLIQNQLGLK